MESNTPDNTQPAPDRQTDPPPFLRIYRIFRSIENNASLYIRIALFLITLYFIFGVISPVTEMFTGGNIRKNAPSDSLQPVNNYLPTLFGFKFKGRYTVTDNNVSVSRGNITVLIIYRKLHIVKLYHTIVNLRLEPDNSHSSDKYFYINLEGNSVNSSFIDSPSVFPLRSISDDLKSFYQGHHFFGNKKIHRKGIDKSSNLPYLTTLKAIRDLVVENDILHVCGLSGYLNITTTNTIKMQPSYMEYDDLFFPSYRESNMLYKDYLTKSSNRMKKGNLLKFFSLQYKEYPLERAQVPEWVDGWDSRLGKVWNDTYEPIVEVEKNLSNDDLVGTITSTCGYTISFSAKQVDYRGFPSRLNMIFYIFIFRSCLEAAMNIVQLLLINTDSEASRISILSLFMLSLIEVAEFFIILIQSLSLPISALGTLLILLLKFIIMMLIQMKMIATVFRSYRQTFGISDQQFKYGLTLIFKRYLCMVFLVLGYFCAYYDVKPLLILPIYLCWVPQICLDMWKGQRRSMNMYFVYIIAISKTLLPLYVYYCPKNIFFLDEFVVMTDMPNKAYSFFVFTSTIIQLGVMTIQKLLDPRWIASFKFLPKIYNYERNWILPDGQSPECVICMSQIQYKSRNWCVTPCDHIFHTCCLMEWTRVRLECPNCRSNVNLYRHDTSVYCIIDVY